MSKTGKINGSDRLNGAVAAAVAAQSQQPRVLPFVTVTVNPGTETGENPYGIQIQTNLPIEQPELIPRLLADAVSYSIGIMEARRAAAAKKPNAGSVLMPDGSPAAVDSAPTPTSSESTPEA